MSVFNFFELKSQPLWDQYVLKHPNGSVFHLSAMFRALKDSEGHSPFNIAACNREGDIVAMLAAVKVDQPCEGLLSTPTSHSVMYAEPLCDDTPEGTEALVQLLNMYDRVWSKESLFSEIRPVECTDQQAVIFLEQKYQRLNSRNLVIDLTGELDAFPQFPSCAMADISVEQASADSARSRVSSFIRSNSPSMETAETLVSYLSSLFEHLPTEIVRLRFATMDGRDVALSVGLVFKGRFVSWFRFASTDAGVESIASLIQKEIEEALHLKLARYDFGNSDWKSTCPLTGPVEAMFEKHRISRCYYKKIGLKLSMALQQKEEVIRGSMTRLSLCESQPPKGAHHD